MHTTPWFHATNIPNAPATNLVQIGIGGWQAPRAGVKVGRARGTPVMTVGDVERVGIDKMRSPAPQQDTIVGVERAGSTDEGVRRGVTAAPARRCPGLPGTRLRGTRR
ncbi:hypothetical protein FRACA_560027 [Frankia canadensis]|uniref:Uncharacterized protein n=1 Tax=Frankia canadensis TaxID=1836972 RepID=A0A2I2KZ28_9ACTN|nr:hypothetical protein FRACA_560027 [Frankia canadensis]SOU58199.1 hypothetical protein FRACA_560027 [Frankia canadensis]